MDGLRVAFCIDNMNVGGTELNAVRTAEALLERGVHLRVFSLASEGPLLGRYAASGIPVDKLPLGGMYSRQALSQGRRMRHVIRAHRIGIVHAHDAYSNIFGAPWSRVAGVRFIASRRWWEGSESPARRWANRASYVLADRVLANSGAIAEMLHRDERVPRRKLVVVPNFLDDAAFDPPPPDWLSEQRHRLSLPDDALVAGVLASLQPIKDHGTLLRAAALLGDAHPNLYLVLVGRDAGSQPELERLARELGIAERVRFAGFMPSQPSPHHLFDVAVLTSVSEGFPNTVLEAMAAGRPVVATRVGAVADALDDDVTGRIVPPQDPVALASALVPLLESPALRARMGEAGRVRARRDYGRGPAIDHLISIYGQLARQHRG